MCIRDRGIHDHSEHNNILVVTETEHRPKMCFLLLVFCIILNFAWLHPTRGFIPEPGAEIRMNTHRNPISRRPTSRASAKVLPEECSGNFCGELAVSLYYLSFSSSINRTSTSRLWNAKQNYASSLQKLLNVDDDSLMSQYHCPGRSC